LTPAGCRPITWGTRQWPGSVATPPARTRRFSSMPASKATATKRERHVPQKGAPGVYWSRRGDGSRVYEVRHPGKARLYETVGTRLDQAKARAREVHGAPVQIASVATRLDEAYTDWKRKRNVRPHSAASFDGMWRLHIEPTFGHRKVRGITSHDMEA